jgi:hypothetical protein
MEHEGTFPSPGPDEGEKLLDMLRGRQDIALQGLHDVADADEEVALGRDRLRAPDLGSGSHEAHHMAGACLGDSLVQAGEGADVKGRHGLDLITAGSSYTIRFDNMPLPSHSNLILRSRAAASRRRLQCVLESPSRRIAGAILLRMRSVF